MPTAPTSPSAIPTAVRRRIIAVLFAGQSFFSAGQLVTFAVLPIVVVELAGTEAIAGLPATLSLIGRAAAAFPVGWLMDRLGRRFGLSIGFLFAIAGSVLAILAIGWVSLIGFLAGIVLSGMGRGIAEQARYAAAEVETADRRAKAIGLVVFASTVGAVVGPRLLAPSESLARTIGLDSATGPFLVGAALFYLAFMLTALFLRPDPMLVGKQMEAEQPESDDGADSSLARSLRTIFKNWYVRLSLFAMTIGQLVMTMIMIITPLYMNNLGYTSDDIGWVLTAHTTGMFALAGLTGWLIDRTSTTTMIALGSILLIISAILAPLAFNLVLLMVALFLLGLGWNFCFVAGSSLLSGALRPVERGRVQGASETFVALASGLGSLSVGVIYTQGGINGIGMGGVVLSTLLLFATLWLMRVGPQAVGVSGD